MPEDSKGVREDKPEDNPACEDMQIEDRPTRKRAGVGPVGQAAARSVGRPEVTIVNSK